MEKAIAWGRSEALQFLVSGAMIAGLFVEVLIGGPVGKVFLALGGFAAIVNTLLPSPSVAPAFLRLRGVAGCCGAITLVYVLVSV